MRLTKRIKILISGSLFVLSAVLALLAGKLSCALAALAMGVSAVGDALLAGYPGCFAEIKNRLTKGGLVFLAAHILYILALIASTGKSARALLPDFARPFSLFFGLTALHGALFYFRARSPVPRAFFAAAFFYLLTAGAHAAAAIAVFGQSGGGYALNVAGTLLFYLSDAILLARKYGAVQGKRVSSLIWCTYVPSQLCLIIGFYLTR
ncbi:MAG: hypothetical protein IKQ41_00355 [Clostridia bacterium]|nr:hypothetical protein [Clostridia bacterium]